MPLYLFLAGAGTEESELKNRLENAWVFHVSLENESSAIKEAEHIVMQIIGIRMLWQLLPNIPLTELISGYEAPHPIIIIELLRLREKREREKVTAILVVDGLQAVSKNSTGGLDENVALYDIFSNMKGLGVSGMFVIPCCTASITTWKVPMWKMTHRRRVYLPVASIDASKPVSQEVKYFMGLLE
ncbi:uncharacterized protein VTP21DRAFT_3307 [Calcarisporiella thermophila]|uniref:uncharacterized protein n=1 Tax=Calcarisporiella thermophila TaxID=911321 RepID=UPI00374379AB